MYPSMLSMEVPLPNCKPLGKEYMSVWASCIFIKELSTESCQERGHMHHAVFSAGGPKI